MLELAKVSQWPQPWDGELLRGSERSQPPVPTQRPTFAKPPRARSAAPPRRPATAAQTQCSIQPCWRRIAAGKSAPRKRTSRDRCTNERHGGEPSGRKNSAAKPPAPLRLTGSRPWRAEHGASARLRASRAIRSLRQSTQGPLASLPSYPGSALLPAPAHAALALATPSAPKHRSMTTPSATRWAARACLTRLRQSLDPAWWPVNAEAVLDRRSLFQVVARPTGLVKRVQPRCDPQPECGQSRAAPRGPRSVP